MEPELLPCPFCGAVPTIEPWHGGRNKLKRMIACDNEACEVTPQVTGSTAAQAARYWNSRAPQA